jgi:hypothetical protein
MSNTEPLADAVRNWVHFDNLYAMLSKQASAALNMKRTFEERVLSLIGGTKRIKINSAILEPATRRNSIPLNWTVLEESLHKYYEKNKKTDETEEIINFIQTARGTKTTTYIKKIPDTVTTLANK